MQETTTIPITFAFTIRNQFTASLTTIRASLAEKASLYKLRKDFYTSAAETAKKSPIRGYVFGDPSDHTRTKAFLDLLLLHEIEVYANGTSITMGGQRFEKDHSLVAAGQTLLHYLQVGARHSLRGVGRDRLELGSCRLDPRRWSRGFLLGAQVGRQGHETGAKEMAARNACTRRLLGIRELREASQKGLRRGAEPEPGQAAGKFGECIAVELGAARGADAQLGGFPIGGRLLGLTALATTLPANLHRHSLRSIPALRLSRARQGAISSMEPFCRGGPAK